MERGMDGMFKRGSRGFPIKYHVGQDRAGVGKGPGPPGPPGPPWEIGTHFPKAAGNFTGGYTMN